jgi:hypothetical protein
MSTHSGALEAVDRILNRGGDADDILHSVLAALHERVFSWVAVAGREVGERPAAPPLRTPVLWQGRQVGELQAVPRDPSVDDRALLERVALLISAQLAP